MRRLLIALGISIILIFNILSLPVAAEEAQEIHINYGVGGSYTVFIPSKVEFTKEEIKESHRYVSKPINIAVGNSLFAVKKMKVKISNSNTFKLVRKDGKSIDFSLYDKKFDENNLQSNKLYKGDYIDMRTQGEFDDWQAFWEWIINNLFGMTFINGRYGQCFTVIDKGSINSQGQYNGQLTFEFEVD